MGHGFLENIYKNALVEELRAHNFGVIVEKPCAVYYRSKAVGKYIADLVVDDRVTVELKVAEALTSIHAAQLANYLRVSRLPIGLLFNFGKPRVELKRVLLTEATSTD